MKILILILSLHFVSFCAFAQADTSRKAKPADTSHKVKPADTSHKVKPADTAANKPARLPVRKIKRVIIADTIKRRTATDTIKKAGSLAKADSMSSTISDTGRRMAADTVRHAAGAARIKKPVDSIYRRLLDNPFTKSKLKPIYLVISERERQSKDGIFYLLLGLLLFLAFIKLVFSRYFKNIFMLLFQPSFRQKQTREQLLQNNLPSLLLNLFFIFSAGTYVSFLIRYYHLTDISIWLLLLYCTGFLLVLYLGKFIFLSFAGWVFDLKEAANAYIFSIYFINKILGVILIPFTLLIAFSPPFVINISVTFSLLIVLMLYIYRYLVSYGPVRKELKVSALHFLLYLFAFEILPLLLIYKTLIIYLNKSL